MQKTNKIKIEIEMTHAQKKDFMKAINHIVRQGCDMGRACQLLAADYLAGAVENFFENGLDKVSGFAKIEKDDN